MKNPEFQVIIPCGTNGDYYAAHLIQNMLRTCSGEHDFDIIIGVNNYPEFNQDLFNRFESQQVGLTFNKIDTETELGSMGHGIVLDTLFSSVTAPRTLLVDCDSAFMSGDWDAWLLQAMEERIGIVGSEYHPRSNFPKYLNYPNALVCMFDTELFREKMISFKPHPNKGAHRVTAETAFAYDRPEGSEIYLDTGYMIPVTLRHEFPGKVLPFKDSVIGTGQEFHANGKPFVSHLKGSSITPFTDPRAQHWVSAVDSYLTQKQQYRRSI